MNGLELACASQKEPALGDGLPLLDANFSREEKRGGRSCLKSPTLLPGLAEVGGEGGARRDQARLNINITHV